MARGRQAAEALLAWARRYPALSIGLAAGLVVTVLLALPWFGGGGEGPRGAAPVEAARGLAPATPPEPEPEAEPMPEPPSEPEPEAPAPEEAAPEPPPRVIASLVPAEPPEYRPDAALAGGSLASVRSEPAPGGGAAGTLPEIRALGPEHVGASMRPSPSLYWFLSAASPVPVEIRVFSDPAAPALAERRIEPPVDAGLHALRLDRSGVRLEPGTTYRFTAALVADAAAPDTDLVSGAAIRYAPPEATPAKALATGPPAELAHRLAAAGYWYDAFDLLTRWVQADPDAERLRDHRASLLEQVGLAGVAALLPAPLPALRIPAAQSHRSDVRGITVAGMGAGEATGSQEEHE
jgi:hypothetical protein